MGIWLFAIRMNIEFMLASDTHGVLKLLKPTAANIWSTRLNRNICFSH